MTNIAIRFSKNLEKKFSEEKIREIVDNILRREFKINITKPLLSINLPLFKLSFEKALLSNDSLKTGMIIALFFNRRK